MRWLRRLLGRETAGERLARAVREWDRQNPDPASLARMTPVERALALGISQREIDRDSDLYLIQTFRELVDALKRQVL